MVSRHKVMKYSWQYNTGASEHLRPSFYDGSKSLIYNIAASTAVREIIYKATRIQNCTT